MMPHSPAVLDAATAGGFLLVLAIVVPVVGVLLAFAAGGRWVERIVLSILPLGLAIAVAIVIAMRQTGAPLVYLLGGWAPPLGVALRADGLSTVMMAIAAVVICAIGIFARADFCTPEGAVEARGQRGNSMMRAHSASEDARERADDTRPQPGSSAREPFAFWILLLAIWGALNTVFLAGDLFTLYVALELLTFAAVPLVCLDGRGETLRAALRYLLFALLGSALYLVGTALLYGAYGTLDIVLLSKQVHVTPVTLVAAALMTVGLLAKTALVPLHLWLPPAHAGAPPAASAVLSALVVKGSFFIVVRIWFGVMPALPGIAATQLIAALGASAIVLGSVVALRQERLKLLIAYSTLAQIGYLFLIFPLAFDAGSAQLVNGGALAGGMLQAISHATAKAAMFMSAGLMYASLGHDRITGLGGIGRALPMSVLAFALGGVALIGLPPSGAYLAKGLLLNAATETGQWWWVIVIQAGGIFTGSYVLLVLVHALARADEPVVLRVRVPRIAEAAALALALCSLLLGLVPWDALLSVPAGTTSNPLTLAALSSALWPIIGGAVLAILLGRWGHRLMRIFLRIPMGEIIVAAAGPARRTALVLGRMLERVDGTLRQWPAAGISLLVVAVMLGAAMLAGR
jgi:formate hydrogenlyase subunit 3/multisubunit Na+/H+ antiporter MnhD subunit